jgi:hypothetical protein
MIEIKLEFFLRVSRVSDSNFNILTGIQRPFLTSGWLELIGPNADRNTLVTILASRTKKIISEMAHTVSQQVFKLYLRDILKKILFKERFSILKVSTLKCS